VELEEWQEVKRGGKVRLKDGKVAIDDIMRESRFKELCANEGDEDSGRPACAGNLRGTVGLPTQCPRQAVALPSNRSLKKVKKSQILEENGKKDFMDGDRASICAVPFAGCCPPGLRSSPGTTNVER
jgi:hypothetical protein